MTYFESAQGQTISHKRAIQELRKHGVPDSEFDAFYAECGQHDEYDAQTVLEWLGY